MRLQKISNNCHSVNFNGVEVFFSYETAIGLHNHNTGFKGRVKNLWSKTTGKHFNECGLKNAVPFETEQGLKECINGNLAYPTGL